MNTLTKNTNTKEIISSQSSDRLEKMRNPQEITARYNLRIQQYKELNASKVDDREQRLMIYTEIKVIGWILGKKEKTIIKEMNAPLP
ncbi:MAG: hypothetical protein IKI81_05205 [Selenomonadaceae bacterium]|nr:hypothetical protein [Selenomonadaceae bacterium]